MKLYVYPGLIFLLLTACNGSNKTPDKNQPANDTPTVQKMDTARATMTDTLSHGKIDIETFGAIKIGQPASQTIAALGTPDKKTKPTEWGADGLLHEDWTYTKSGLHINLSSEAGNAENSKIIFSITANAPCDLKTRAGIGIGSSYDEVQQAYTRDIDKENTTKEQITVGSVYGAIIFSFRQNKVVTIFLGASAE